MDSLFYNTRERYPDGVEEVELASWKEVNDKIVNWQDGGPQIDFGITEDNKNYGRFVQKLGIQIEEFRQAFSSIDENSKYGILNESRPDRIIGWAKCKVKTGGKAGYVYAPIIPFPTGSNLTAPTRFNIENLVVDSDTDSIVLQWKVSEDLEGQYCKVHDGMGGAGKSMVTFSSTTDLGTLLSGHAIDMVTAAESFASRRLAWGKRMSTLKTLAMVMSTPPYGYNYAEHDASFPDNPEIKERLKAERIPLEEWPNIIGNIKRFSADPEIDSLLRDQVLLAIKTGTVNPSDILATKYGNRYSFMYVDYDFMFDTSINFQNALMKWYNSMQPSVCPKSIDDYGNGGYLFKPLISDSEYDTGCLQMAVPHKNTTNDGVSYHWENVYISFSFFNDDYSGLHKIGLNGANRTMEQLAAMAISGKELSGSNMRLYTRNTAARSNRAYGSNDIELDYGKFIRRKR